MFIDEKVGIDQFINIFKFEYVSKLVYIHNMDVSFMGT